MSEPAVKVQVPPPPTGLGRIAWLGPGFLWMVSAAGSGELLFTPRVGALYGYALLWALLVAVALKWFVNREVGRYTVVTGRTILEGFARLPGPRGWAVWLIVLPQLVVAVATIAGLAGSAATALVLALPGDVRIWTVGAIVAAAGLVLLGRYRLIERVAIVFAVVLALASITAALSVGPDVAELAGGISPQLPPELDYAEVLPWLGFMLSGAAGMIWYSYWLREKGYGAAGGDESSQEGNGAAQEADKARRERLRGWLRQLTLDNSVAVLGTLLITVAFLVLGAELLRPEGLVPEEDRVAEVLGQLLGTIWGPIGFWFMVTAVFIGFWDTVLSDQDGFGRMFASGTRLIARASGVDHLPAPETLRRLFVGVVTGALPIGLYLLVGEPVGLLQLAGAIEAAHIPILAGLALYVGRQELPPDLRPSRLSFAMTALAGAFFAVFALLFAGQLGGLL
ncbi:MAG: Nramp family divalent metal transporter [Candidatus Limnocylindria bacterium]